MTKENLFGSGACTLFSHRVTYSLHDGGSHGMNLAMAGVMHPKTSCESIIWNWLSCNLGDWMTIIVSAVQRRIIRQLIAGENRLPAQLSVDDNANYARNKGCVLRDNPLLHTPHHSGLGVVILALLLEAHVASGGAGCEFS